MSITALIRSVENQATMAETARFVLVILVEAICCEKMFSADENVNGLHQKSGT
jgi:hypothetical protein